MAKDDLAQLEGQVVDAAAGGIYKVKLENAVEISAKLCGKMRRFNIRVVGTYRDSLANTTGNDSRRR